MNQLVTLITRQIILPLNIWLLAVIYSNAYGQTTPKLLTQKFKVSIDSLFEVQALEGSEGLAERFTEQAAKALDSLQRELGFVFHDNFRSQAPEKSDILIKGKLYYGSPPRMVGYPGSEFDFEKLDWWKTHSYRVCFLQNSLAGRKLSSGSPSLRTHFGKFYFLQL